MGLLDPLRSGCSSGTLSLAARSKESGAHGRWLGKGGSDPTYSALGEKPVTRHMPTFRLLENVLRAVVVPDRLAPVAGVVVTYRVGSDEAPTGFPGTAHALEI